MSLFPLFQILYDHKKLPARDFRQGALLWVFASGLLVYLTVTPSRLPVVISVVIFVFGSVTEVSSPTVRVHILLLPCQIE